MSHDLESTARAIVAPGKGILAADESAPTIKKRFDSIGVESSEDQRRFYRELLFTTQGASEFISGVIQFDETARQKASSGTALPVGAAVEPPRRRRTGPAQPRVDVAPEFC